MAKRRKSGLTKKEENTLFGFLFWLIFVSWWIWIVYLVKAIKKIIKKRENAAVQITPILEESQNADAAHFEAVGVAYRIDDLLSVADASRSYDLSDEKILEKYENGQRLYKYFFNDAIGELVPEPSNKYDKNAIKIELNGVKVAYVPADLCKEVKTLLKNGAIPRVTVRGGPYKYIENGVVYEENNKFHIYVDFAD